MVWRDVGVAWRGAEREKGRKRGMERSRGSESRRSRERSVRARVRHLAPFRLAGARPGPVRSDVSRSRVEDGKRDLE